MRKLNRRKFVKTLAAAGAALASESVPAAHAALSSGVVAGETWDVLIIGAGVFGAWTALSLRRAGRKVVLVDQYGPANSRASSGGETRIIRMGYGSKELYSRWAWQSLAEWNQLFVASHQPLFRPTGVLWMGKTSDEEMNQNLVTLAKLSIPFQRLSRSDLAGRFPQIALEDDMFGILEPAAGALLARRAVQLVVAQAVQEGVEYRTGLASAPSGRGPVESVSVNGEPVPARAFVFACGPWLPRIFPALLKEKIVPSRGEEFYFGPAAGDRRYSENSIPTWIDNAADTFGAPDIEGRGFKIGIDPHGPPFDPDRDSRTLLAESYNFAREYAARRFPGLKDAPLVEHRVCQYENTSNEDFLIDRHPEHENVWLVGGGSGHGFKHGPALGAYVAKRVIEGGPVDPIFSLANKGPVTSPSIFNR